MRTVRTRAKRKTRKGGRKAFCLAPAEEFQFAARLTTLLSPIVILSVSEI